MYILYIYIYIFIIVYFNVYILVGYVFIYLFQENKSYEEYSFKSYTLRGTLVTEPSLPNCSFQNLLWNVLDLFK